MFEDYIFIWNTYYIHGEQQILQKHPSIQSVKHLSR